MSTPRHHVQISRRHLALHQVPVDQEPCFELELGDNERILDAHFGSSPLNRGGGTREHRATLWIETRHEHPRTRAIADPEAAQRAFAEQVAANARGASS